MSLISNRLVPSANIFASSFDRYVDAVSNIPDSNLPLIGKEIGDTWIHGIASDPVFDSFLYHLIFILFSSNCPRCKSQMT
jgi:hypothetical protein